MAPIYLETERRRSGKVVTEKRRLGLHEIVELGDKRIEVTAGHAIVVTNMAGERMKGKRVLIGVMINNANLEAEGKKVTWQEK
jgi:hypothetical protein